jgi:hypothetical protein
MLEVYCELVRDSDYKLDSVITFSILIGKVLGKWSPRRRSEDDESSFQKESF